MSPESLEKAFGFTAADLAANQKGILTDAQRKAIRHSYLRGARLWFLITAAIVVVFGLSVLFNPSGNLTPLIFAGGIAGVMVFLSVRSYGTLMQEANSIGAAEVCGTIQIDTYGSAFVLVIGEEAFGITATQRALLHEGDRYCVYFNPRTFQILSISAASPP